MTGPLRKPVFATDIAAQDAVTIDQVPFSTMTASAVLQTPILTIETLRAVPQAGGVITGSGRYTFAQNGGNLALNLTGDRLPADALGRPYGLPENLAIGPVFVDANVNGPVNQLTTTATWRAPAGNYPARGDLRFANGTLQFTDTFVQVAGGNRQRRGHSGQSPVVRRFNGSWSAAQPTCRRGAWRTHRQRPAGRLPRQPFPGGHSGPGYRHRCPGRGQSGGPGQPRRGQLDR